jgi:hypothetical protein
VPRTERLSLSLLSNKQAAMRGVTYQTQGTDLRGQGRCGADLATGAPQVHWERVQIRASAGARGQAPDPPSGLDCKTEPRPRRTGRMDTARGQALPEGVRAARPPGRPFLPPHLQVRPKKDEARQSSPAPDGP